MNIILLFFNLLVVGGFIGPVIDTYITYNSYLTYNSSGFDSMPREYDSSAIYNQKLSKEQIDAELDGDWKYPQCRFYWKLDFPPPYTIEKLDKLTTTGLKEICTTFGLPDNGIKSALVKRVHQSNQNRNISHVYKEHQERKQQRQQQRNKNQSSESDNASSDDNGDENHNNRNRSSKRARDKRSRSRSSGRDRRGSQERDRGRDREKRDERY